MALKSTSTPLDQLLLTEWRTQFCAIEGVDYDSMPTAWQTLFNDTLNRSFEYLSQRAAHHPWGQQETTLSVSTGTDQTFSMPAAFRHLVEIYEVGTDGGMRPATQSTKGDFYRAQSGTTHPWAARREPVWFFDGLTSDQPPVQQWRRIGSDNAGGTAYVLFRPYFNLLTTSGQDAYPYLPAAESSALLHFIKREMSAWAKDYTAMQAHDALMKDHISALEVNDRTTVEAPMRLGTDPDFGRLLG